jgi:hypothetical protein
VIFEKKSCVEVLYTADDEHNGGATHSSSSKAAAAIAADTRRSSSRRRRRFETRRNKLWSKQPLLKHRIPQQNQPHPSPAPQPYAQEAHVRGRTTHPVFPPMKNLVLSFCGLNKQQHQLLQCHTTPHIIQHHNHIINITRRSHTKPSVFLLSAQHTQHTQALWPYLSQVMRVRQTSF